MARANVADAASRLEASTATNRMKTTPAPQQLAEQLAEGGGATVTPLFPNIDIPFPEPPPEPRFAAGTAPPGGGRGPPARRKSRPWNPCFAGPFQSWSFCFF